MAEVKALMAASAEAEGEVVVEAAQRQSHNCLPVARPELAQLISVRVETATTAKATSSTALANSAVNCIAVIAVSGADPPVPVGKRAVEVAVTAWVETMAMLMKLATKARRENWLVMTAAANEEHLND